MSQGTKSRDQRVKTGIRGQSRGVRGQSQGARGKVRD